MTPTILGIAAFLVIAYAFYTAIPRKRTVLTGPIDENIHHRARYITERINRAGEEDFEACEKLIEDFNITHCTHRDIVAEKSILEILLRRKRAETILEKVMEEAGNQY